jgi:5'(3')-deoxyribonucleotidase
MQRIAIDMDDVLADALGAEVAWFRQRYGYAWTRAELIGKRLFADLAAPEHDAAHLAMLREGTFFADLPVLPGAVRVVRALAERYELFVASAATQFPGSFGPKFRWLARHFPFIPASHVVFCGDKSIVQADYLIDDSPENFQRFRGQGILFDSPVNAGETRYPRVASWEEVERLFLAGQPPCAAPR